jgi:intracellular septation protein
MQLLFDFLPVVAFFVTFKFAGIFAATGVLITAVLLQTAIQWFHHRKVSGMALTSAALVLVFGGLTLWLRDESLIKWKVSVLNWLLAAVFLGSQYIGSQPIVQRLMGSVMTLEAQHWRRLNWLWVGFFLVVGVINYYVMTHFDTETWANFKLYGVFGLTGVFIVVQTLWLSGKVRDVQPAEQKPSAHET